MEITGTSFTSVANPDPEVRLRERLNWKTLCTLPLALTSGSRFATAKRLHNLMLSSAQEQFWTLLSVLQQFISSLDRLIVEVPRSHTVRHTHTHTHTLGRTPLNKRSARRRGWYLYKAAKARDEIIHSLGGIRHCDPRNRVTADLRLRQHGHRNGLILIKFTVI